MKARTIDTLRTELDMLDYRIITSDGITDFEIQVSDLMQIGWKLVGGPMIIQQAHAEPRFYQALQRSDVVEIRQNVARKFMENS